MILDIILILIIAIATFIGYKKGFVKVIIKLTTVVLAIVLAFILQGSVSKFIGENLGFKNTISTAIENKLVDFTKSDEEGTKRENQIPVLDKTINNINKAADEEKQAVIKSSSSKIADFVVKGMSFIVIFLVVAITMGIVGLILNTVVELPVLKTLNGLFGGITEFVLMLFRIFIVLAIISFLSPLELLAGVVDYINDSCITRWLFENNIIVSIIGSKLI